MAVSWKHTSIIKHQVPVGAVPGTLKLVKDAVVLVERAQLAAEIIMNL